MNKGIIKVVVPVLILVELCFIFLSFASFSNKNIEEIKKFSKIDRKQFAMYVEIDEGKYEEYNKNIFPNGYIMNTIKSKCVDNNGDEISDAVSFKSNRLTITSNKTIFCYVYLDKADLVISVVTDGDSDKIPESLGYTKTVSCDNESSPTWNYKYNRLEIGNVNTEETKCTLTYTKDNTHDALISVVETANVNNNYDGNGYRYSGPNPNNYVWFNNEMWRIIGSIPTCTSSGCATQENLIKIIRNEPIGSLVYDAHEENFTSVWGENTLYTLLNTHYYATSREKLNGTNTDYCYGYGNSSKTTCDYTRNGILSNSNYGKMVKKVYWNTGASGFKMSALEAYDYEITKQTVGAYIGLMNVSDYGYATNSEYHENATDIYAGIIASNNWMFSQGYEWTMDNHSIDAESIVVVNNEANTTNYYAYRGFITRPVVYLDSSVYVISGEGTNLSPYMIGMN